MDATFSIGKPHQNIPQIDSKRQPVLGQGNPSRRSFNELVVDPCLQSRNPTADRRLGYAELACSSTKAAMIGDGKEGLSLKKSRSTHAHSGFIISIFSKINPFGVWSKFA